MTKWRITQTGENSIIEARILYHSNPCAYIVLLFAVKCKFMTRGGATSPQIFLVSFWKSYTDHWQLPLLQNWPLQWPPHMKTSGFAPVYDVMVEYNN